MDAEINNLFFSPTARPFFSPRCLSARLAGIYYGYAHRVIQVWRDEREHMFVFFCPMYGPPISDCVSAGPLSCGSA